MDTPLPWTLYAMCAIAAVGIPANILTIVIMLQPSMRIHSTFLYLFIITVLDTGVLFLWLLGDMAVFEVIDLADRHLMFVTFFRLLSLLLMGALIIYRCKDFVLPLCDSMMCNENRSITVILIILYGASIAFGNWFTIGIPIVALLVLNSLIIYQICKRSVTHESAESEQMKTEDGQRCTKPITSRTEPDKTSLIMLITTFSFLMLTLPSPATYFMSRPMYVQVSYVLCYYNYALKMFLYSLSEKRFREQMLNLPNSVFKKCNVLSNNGGSMSCRYSDKSCNANI